VLRGADHAQALDLHADADIAGVAGTANTQALLRVHRDGRVDAWFAPGFDLHSTVDGRGLAAVLLVPLFAQLSGEHPGLLDKPIAAWLPEWKEDRRGLITPRQLFWQLSGLPARAFNPLNPFSSRAQLASGPDFARAAMRWQPDFPPATHFEESPVNAQLLALVASSIDGAPLRDMLQKRLWSPIARDDALAMLDHRRGDVAAHCCLRASLGDWLRLALLLAADGRNGQSALWAPGFLSELVTASPVHEGYGMGFQLQAGPQGPLLRAASTGRQLWIAPQAGAALLWVGEGTPPAGLPQLLR
jgi:CubicO group peptidase (beta-lactamase class C family)